MKTYNLFKIAFALCLGVLASSDSMAQSGSVEEPLIIENKRVRIEIRKRNGVSDTTVTEEIRTSEIPSGSSSATKQAMNGKSDKNVKMEIRNIDGVPDTLIVEETRSSTVKVNPNYKNDKDQELEEAEVEMEEADNEIAQAMKEVEEAMNEVQKELEITETELQNGSNHEVPRRSKIKTVETNWFVMDLGWNVWLSNNTFDLPAEYEALTLDRGRSLNFHLGIIQKGVNIYQGKLRFVYGIGIEFNNFRLAKDVDVVRDTRPMEFSINDDVKYRKNELEARYATMPLMLNFKSKAGKSSDEFKLAAGVQLGYLVGSHQKQKWGKGSSKDKIKLKGDYGFDEFRLGYVAQLGFGNFNIFGKYYPEGVFKEGHGPNVKTACVGLVLTPF